ncbi:MAG: hypothetical protein HPY73_04385 [Methanomassiliicoccales archaeon]|nr:MAG: hypothetical protein HPY73_04385 [Methanomassiliicoccales archaeon]
MDFLSQMEGDVILYPILLFLYAVAAAVFLPIPVEIVLFGGSNTPLVVKALALGAGKAVGSMIVFYIGYEIEAFVRKWSVKWKFFGLVVRFSEWFVSKLKYVGMYLLLSVPLMSDTAVLYVFSLFNKEGTTLEVRKFVIVNFFAGITRVVIVWAFFEWLGYKLV